MILQESLLKQEDMNIIYINKLFLKIHLNYVKSYFTCIYLYFITMQYMQILHYLI